MRYLTTNRTLLFLMFFFLSVIITSCAMKSYMERTSGNRAIPQEFKSSETTIIIELFGRSMYDGRIKKAVSISEYPDTYVFLEKDEKERHTTGYAQRDSSKNILIDTAFPDKAKFRYVLGHQMAISRVTNYEGQERNATMIHFYVYDRISDKVYWPSVRSPRVSKYLKAYLTNLEQQNK